MFLEVFWKAAFCPFVVSVASRKSLRTNYRTRAWPTYLLCKVRSLGERGGDYSHPMGNGRHSEDFVVEVGRCACRAVIPATRTQAVL